MAGITEEQQKKDLQANTLNWLEITMVKIYSRYLYTSVHISESYFKMLVKKDNPSGMEVRKIQTALETILYGFILNGEFHKSDEDYNDMLIRTFEDIQAETRTLLHSWKRLYPLKETIEIV